MIKKILKIITNIIFIISLLILFVSIYINHFFEGVSFELILYSIVNFKGTSISVILRGLIFISLIFIFLFIFIKLIKLLFKKIKILDKIFKIIIKIEYILKIFIIIISLIISYKLLKIDDFYNMLRNSTSIYEDYYVDPRKVEIKFPKDKQNLIYIYLESMEMTGASKKNGGFVSRSYIPNLESLALNNINFSNTSNLGGAISIYGTNYTSSSLVAQTSGVQLKVSIGWAKYKHFGKSLPGVKNLGDILEENGYKNYFIMGSDADYGGRKDYFRHGNYKMLDYYWAIDEKKIDKDYYVWWGYEDKKLFEYAKEQLKTISKNDEPFNFTMLTVDTHFTDGYMDDSCSVHFNKKYADAIYCSDSKVGEFIDWVKKQDFYKNTTIIITGDHLTKQRFFYRDSNTYKRTIYNSIINSRIEPINEKNRLFTPFDMFPTTLASIGVTIENDRLGLGTNLFSNKKTLAEVMGIEKLENELKKKSFYYDNVLLKDHYYKMQEVSDTNEKKSN